MQSASFKLVLFPNNVSKGFVHRLIPSPLILIADFLAVSDFVFSTNGSIAECGQAKLVLERATRTTFPRVSAREDSSVSPPPQRPGTGESGQHKAYAGQVVASGVPAACLLLLSLAAGPLHSGRGPSAQSFPTSSMLVSRHADDRPPLQWYPYSSTLHFSLHLLLQLPVPVGPPPLPSSWQGPVLDLTRGFLVVPLGW